MFWGFKVSQVWELALTWRFFEGLGVRVYGLGVRVYGLGFRV